MCPDPVECPDKESPEDNYCETCPRLHMEELGLVFGELVSNVVNVMNLAKEGVQPQWELNLVEYFAMLAIQDIRVVEAQREADGQYQGQGPGQGTGLGHGQGGQGCWTGSHPGWYKV